MSACQPDLFENHPNACEEAAAAPFEPPPPDFISRLRQELDGTLQEVRRAESLPWSDLTRATLAELRFHSIAKWLPRDEAVAMCAAFEAEMARLYDREDTKPSTDGR